MGKISQDIVKVFMEHPSSLNHRLQTRVGCPEVPPFKVMQNPSLPSVTPEVSKTLLNRPCPGRLELHLLENRKPFLMLLWEVFLRVQPKILGSSQRLIAYLFQNPMFLLAHLIHGLAHVRHQMIAIKHDLILRLGKMCPHRRNIRIPDIHRHCLNAFLLLLGETLKVTIQTRLLPVLRNILYRGGLQITDQRHIGVSFADRLLIDPNPRTNPFLFRHQTPLDRSLQNMPSFVPTDPQNPSDSKDVTLPKNINGQPFKQQGESSL